MKNERPPRRPAHSGNVMAVLARARPARLTADAAVRDSWSAPNQIIEAADNPPPCYLQRPDHEQLGRGRFRRGWLGRGWLGRGSLGRGRLRLGLARLRSLAGTKLAGALTSAAVTAVVIVIAVVAGAGVLTAPHRPSPSQSQSPVAPSSSASSAPVQPPANAAVFHSLPLGPHWHGNVAYAVRNGVVYLEGIATLDRQASRSGHYGAVVRLPRFARPADPADIVVSVSAAPGFIGVGADGQVRVFKSHAYVTWVSLTGVSFPIDS